jgi:polyisoprenyl-teichoic acid--peptidoglycan teichoic acid transferase
MSNYYDRDDDFSTQPAQPRRSDQGQQGKLVLGSFKNPPQQQRWSNTPYTPSPPEAPRYPRPSQEGYPPNRYQSRKANKPGRFRRIGCLSLLGLAVLLCGLMAIVVPNAMAFGSKISTQTPFSTQTGYMGTTDRVNVLMMGYGGGDHPGANLTDSLSVMSVMPPSHHTSIISVPRDLWLASLPNVSQDSKINAVYSNAIANGDSQAQAGDQTAQAVSNITGLDVKYWVTINFTGFRNLINALGGIDVYVPDAFNACFPAGDNNNNWIIVQFNKGQQHMDGDTAIEYARAREPVEVCSSGTSENQTELSDFARSARQQIIMKAVLAKVKQVSTWPKIFNAESALEGTIYSNMSLADLGEFVLHMNLNDPNTAHIGLSNQNVLVDSNLADGTYINEPANDDWQGVANYVQQHLYN